VTSGSLYVEADCGTVALGKVPPVGQKKLNLNFRRAMRKRHDLFTLRPEALLVAEKNLLGCNREPLSLDVLLGLGRSKH
jgi:hypothetical protein